MTGQQIIVRDFFHHLHDTLILLGANAQLTELVENPEAIRVAHVDDLRNFNGKLIDTMKDKMVNINKLAVVVGEDEQG